MGIHLSQIYSLIFRSKIDSYSFLPKFHFMNKILFCKHITLHIFFLFTDICQNIHQYLIWILKKYISNMKISHYGFACHVSISNKMYIYNYRKGPNRKGENFFSSFSWIICKFFTSGEYYSHSYLQVFFVKVFINILFEYWKYIYLIWKYLTMVLLAM